MKRDRAAYMREYRARQRTAPILLDAGKRILELEAEVRRLKAELAKRPVMADDLRSFNSRPFTPVPKSRK